MKRRYVDTADGQIHVRIQTPPVARNAAPLVLLPPAPSSGLYFESVMPLLGETRTVIAPDYPGYGGSDPLPSKPTIEDYAASMLACLSTLSLEKPPDLFGFHTGCLVAVEMALMAPASVGQLLLCDVPYFTASEQQALRDKAVVPLSPTSNLESLAGAWQFTIEKRVNDVPLTRAFALFAEHLRAGSNDALAFDAAFRYACVDRFGTVDAETTCIATTSGLYDATIAAQKAIRGATLVEAPKINSAVFEKHAGDITRYVLDAL